MPFDSRTPFRRKNTGKPQGDFKTPPPASNVLKGEVTHTVYEAEDASYSVVRVQDYSGKEYVAVGAMPGIAPGQSVELEGRWEVHQDHGLQLRVMSCKTTLPATKEGLIRYLSSGIVKGVGVQTAKKIVEHFGEETLSVLDNEPRRLMEIKGFPKKSIEAVRKSWAANSDRRELRIFLEG